ncbi:MAG: hypothetical protein AAF085_12090 [Planctomycetota bacterium]
MADIAEKPLIKPTSFTDGTDVYKGIEGINWQKTPLNTVPFIPEGELRPTHLEPVETPGVPWQGTVQLSGIQAAALVDTTIASATVTLKDRSQASGTVTMTITNMVIKDFSSNAERARPNGATHRWEATNVQFA